MPSDTQTIKFDIGAKPINDVIGFPGKVWHAVKKYSINNTLPIATISAWLQFSLAYVAAVIITHNNLNYITDIFNSQLMSAYALASVILGTILLASLIVKHVYKQEIKDEKLKDGKSTIDRKIRGGYSDGINKIAQNALTIEIIPDTSLIGNKKESFSIVLPISEKQGRILENKREENRNKIVLLTVPYVLSGLVVAGALAGFGFTHIKGWEEWAAISAVGIITIVGICITLSKLRNNEVDHNLNIIKKFNDLDILLPWKKGSVVSVMENKSESKEENDLQSQALRLIDDGFLKPVNKILKDVGKNMKREVSGTTNAVKNAAGAVKSAADKLNPSTWRLFENETVAYVANKLNPWTWFPQLQSSTQPRKTQKDGQTQTTESDGGINSETSSTTSNDSHQVHNEKERLEEENKSLKEQEAIEKLRKENARLKERLSPKAKEGREKINGSPSEFLYYVLESIKLKIKNDEGKELDETTLRNFDNKIIIHWRDGSQTICHIQKQGDLQIQPSTKVDFAATDIDKAFKQCV